MIVEHKMAQKSKKNKQQYKNLCSIEANKNDESIDVRIDWGGQSWTLVRSYPEQLLNTITARLYIGSPNIGWKVVNQSIIHGYTEITVNKYIYCCHPFYAKTGGWYYWAYFR